MYCPKCGAVLYEKNYCINCDECFSVRKLSNASIATKIVFNSGGAILGMITFLAVLIAMSAIFFIISDIKLMHEIITTPYAKMIFRSVSVNSAIIASYFASQWFCKRSECKKLYGLIALMVFVTASCVVWVIVELAAEHLDIDVLSSFICMCVSIGFLYGAANTTLEANIY